MASVPKMHTADAAADWIAICADFDYCKVGPKLTGFDTCARLNPWAPMNLDTKVRSRSYMVYRDGDLISGVQGNAGSGVVSQTSLGAGYVKILQPEPSVRVLIKSKPLAHHDSKCMVNTNASGAGGAEGTIQTKEEMPLDKKGDIAGELADDAATFGEGTRKQYRPVNRRGQALPARQAATRTSVLDRLDPKNFTAKPGASSALKGFGAARRVLGPAGDVLGGVNSAMEQARMDLDRFPEMSQATRTGRAATRGAANAGGAMTGAWAFGKAGALIGACIGPKGAIAGFVIGTIVGGLAGGKAADNIVDLSLGNPFPP